jgi:hypothetical protein
MDWDETFVDDGGQDDKKMGADAKSATRNTSGRVCKSSGERSITATTNRLKYADGVIIKVGTIVCSTFGPQRYEFGVPK